MFITSHLTAHITYDLPFPISCISHFISLFSQSLSISQPPYPHVISHHVSLISCVFHTSQVPPYPHVISHHVFVISCGCFLYITTAIYVEKHIPAPICLLEYHSFRSFANYFLSVTHYTGYSRHSHSCHMPRFPKDGCPHPSTYHHVVHSCCF